MVTVRVGNDVNVPVGTAVKVLVTVRVGIDVNVPVGGMGVDVTVGVTVSVSVAVAVNVTVLTAGNFKTTEFRFSGGNV